METNRYQKRNRRIIDIVEEYINWKYVDCRKLESYLRNSNFSIHANIIEDKVGDDLVVFVLPHFKGIGRECLTRILKDDE